MLRAEEVRLVLRLVTRGRRGVLWRLGYEEDGSGLKRVGQRKEPAHGRLNGDADARLRVRALWPVRYWCEVQGCIVLVYLLRWRRHVHSRLLGRSQREHMLMLQLSWELRGILAQRWRESDIPWAWRAPVRSFLE